MKQKCEAHELCSASFFRLFYKHAIKSPG